MGRNDIEVNMSHVVIGTVSPLMNEDIMVRHMTKVSEAMKENGAEVDPIASVPANPVHGGKPGEGGIPKRRPIMIHIHGQRNTAKGVGRRNVVMAGHTKRIVSRILGSKNGKREEGLASVVAGDTGENMHKEAMNRGLMANKAVTAGKNLG